MVTAVKTSEIKTRVDGVAPCEARPPMIMFHTVWMDRYDGDLDAMFPSDFRWPKNRHHAHELNNFKSVGGHCYGHVQVSGKNDTERNINISRLTDNKMKVSELEGVLVIWTAPDPDTKQRTLVGWYRNATVYREPQPLSRALREELRDKESTLYNFRAKARAVDCVLVPANERSISFPLVKPKNVKLPKRTTIYYPGEYMDNQVISDFISKVWARVCSYSDK